MRQRAFQQAMALATRRGSSISRLLAGQIEIPIGKEDACERTERQATALLDQGFHMGAVIRATRDECMSE